MDHAKISRRTFGVGAAILAAVGLDQLRGDVLEHGRRAGERRALKSLLQLHTFPPSPIAVAKTFDRAGPGLLLGSYGNFFPTFMEQHLYWNAPAAIEEAARVHSPNAKNPHRMFALPAVAAAHALYRTRDDRQESVTQFILKALDSRNREVREIVLQNLISASLPSPDVALRWNLRTALLRKVLKVIQESEHEQRLLSPAALAVTLLLNTRNVQNSSPTALGRDEAMRIEDALTRVLSCRAPHFAYLKKLKKRHDQEFLSFNCHDVSSLPSHGTEMLVQASGARKTASRYNACLVEIHAKTTYDVWRTAEGIVRGDDAVMTKKQAEDALPKMLNFEAAAGMLPLLSDVPHADLGSTENDFRDYVRGILIPRVSELAKNPDPLHGELEGMGNLPLPISAYRDQDFAERIGPELYETLGKRAMGWGAAFLFAVASKPWLEIGVGIVNRTICASSEEFSSPPDSSIEADPPDLEEMAHQFESVDRILGPALDEVESEIGPAQVSVRRRQKKPSD